MSEHIIRFFSKSDLEELSAGLTGPIELILDRNEVAVEADVAYHLEQTTKADESGYSNFVLSLILNVENADAIAEAIYDASTRLFGSKAFYGKEQKPEEILINAEEMIFYGSMSDFNEELRDICKTFSISTIVLGKIAKMRITTEVNENDQEKVIIHKDIIKLFRLVDLEDFELGFRDLVKFAPHKLDDYSAQTRLSNLGKTKYPEVREVMAELVRRIKNHSDIN